MRLRYLAGAIPAVGMLGGIFFANRSEPEVLGLPFILFWLVTWVVLTTVVMAVTYWSDPANREENQ
ncbi:DUF3311 domain-containing protein [Kutzneria albida]|uniref:Uncharacterized protein n=1 Tax=Kutzneria albida DSM 43870 TaxID=1449976 RepID=W5WIM0_9PSEU|nr:DUF3311 domain-containing protein [Kutzneria albida]AHI00683.1 hypothetical protein KALB_7325 [Kutzneria albida DSM 43870]